MADGGYEAPPREYSAGRMRVSEIRRPGEGRLSERPYTQDELAADIRANGVQQPLAIEHLPAHGGPTTFNGLHRLDAAERAGAFDVPVVVKHRPGDYPPMTARRPATETEFNAAYDLEREGRWAGAQERTASAAPFVPAADRTESVRHILDNYAPYDADSWDEVRASYNWDHPQMREFVADVARNGVQRPVPIDYEQDPPQVRNGHTRLLAAERAGTEMVPARQHAGFMDPDDPDPYGHQPGHPEHWTSKPEWQASLREQFGPREAARNPVCACNCGCEADGDWHFNEPIGCRCLALGCPCVTDKPLPQGKEAVLLGHFGAADSGRRYYHASDEEFSPGDTVSGGHRLDDLYLADSIPGAHKYYTSGHVYEVEPHAGPQPSMQGEYTVSSGTVTRKVPQDEVDSAVRAAYNAPDVKARRDQVNRRQREHAWRVKNDRWYGHYQGPDKPEWDEYAAHWFPQGPESATPEQSEGARRGTPLPPDVHRWIHGTEALAHIASGEDYRATHRPGSSKYGAPLHDVEDMMPGYHDHNPSLYDNHARAGEPWVSSESDRQIRVARGNPDADVTIYRALPREHREINSGDWVSTSANYARQHAESNLHAAPWAVIKSVVKARHLFTEGDMNEWGYHGPDITGAKVHVHGGPRRQAASEVVAHFEETAATTGNDVTVGYEQQPSGGMAYPRMHVLTATHPDGTTATLRYMTSKRGAKGVVDHFFTPKGYAGSLGKPLVQKARELHPQAFIKGLPGIDEDWGQHLPSVTSVHRNLTMKLSPEDHAIVHDDSVPKAQRARHLMDLMERGGASMHWASQRGRSAAEKFGDHEFRAPGDTQVSVNAEPPAREHVETDPERIAANGGYAYQEPDWEVPLKQGARVNVTSVRWRAGNGGWNRHSFRGGHQFTAGRREEAVVAHFGELEMTAAAEEYGPKPEWQRAPEGLAGKERDAHYDRQSQAEKDWTAAVRRGLSMGHLTPDRAHELGYPNNGHDRNEELWDHEGNVVVRRGWQPMPHEMYHATTNLPAVREHGLKSRRELSQLHGLGLGGGEDDTVSLTSDHGVARNILRAMHEYHGVLNGRKTPQQMWDEARAGTGAQRPFHHELANYYGKWEEGDPLPRRLDEAVRGVEVKTGGLVHSPQEMAEREGPGWQPHRESSELVGGDGVKRYNVWERPASPERRAEHASDLYKNFSYWRGHAGGPDDPLFITNDIHGFAAADPSRFGIAHVRPRPGAQGYPLSSLKEWRTTTGDALEVHRAERLEHGHLKEAAVTLAARYAPGLPNPQTGRDEWFHGTQSQPGDFVHGFSHNDSPSHEEEELTGHLSHWNTLLGSHFAADHGVAEHFARQGASTADDGDDWGGDNYGRSRYQEGDPQSVIHARLHLLNPKVYDSEFDMDHEAYEHEYGERKNYISKHFEEGYEDEDPHSGDYDPETPGDFEEWPLAARYRHDDQQPIPREQMQRRTLFSNPDMPEMPERTRWLNSHPDKAGIARRFREHLESQGHDGVLYGNEFEDSHATGNGGHWNTSAIIFHPHQAEITQHHQADATCLSRDEAEHQRSRMPQPGQEELPGVEEHADKFPGGFLHGARPPARRTAAPAYMQQKLFHAQPDPTLNTLESGRHNPADPLKRVRHRQETERGYVPPKETFDDPELGNRDEERGLYHHPARGWHCYSCTQHEGEPVFHEDPDSADEHGTTYTNWDEDYPRIPGTVHRGIRLDDDGSHGRHMLGAYRDAPVTEHTAREVLGHFGDFGNHWTGDEQQARHYADVGAVNRRGEGDTMNVVIHARKPAREDIETDPEKLHEQNVFGMGYHDDEEIPLQQGAPVHVTGVSWKFHDEPHSAWRRHDFGEGAEHTAALETAPSFTYRYQAPGPEGYEDREQAVSGPFYHGSRSRRLRPGSQVRAGMPTNGWGDEGERSQFVHFTTDLEGARSYATRAGGHVYEVEPTGDVRGGYNGSEWKSEHPLSVIRRVPDDDLPEVTAVTAHFDDEDGGEEWDEEGTEPDLEPAGHERDEHDFIHPMVRDRESGERFPSPFEEPRCLNCERASGTEYRHRPEDGHPVPGVQQRIDGERAREERWDRGEYDRTRYCDLGCEMSHAEDRAHGIGVHHTFGEHEVEEDEPRLRQGEMPQLNGPHEEPVGRQSGSYEVRDPSAEHRCHYCRNILPQYRRQASIDVVAHFSDFPFEDPEHERSTGHKAFDEAYEAVDRDSLWPKEHREFPALSTGIRPDFEDLPRGGEDFRWSEGSPHEHYFKHGPEGWRRGDLRSHLEQDHHSGGLDDAMLRAETRNGRGTADEYLALDDIHRRAHGRELGPVHSEDPGSTSYQELEQGHRWLENAAEGKARQRQQEDDEDRRRQHVTLHGEAANLHEVERHLRDVHGIPQHAMPAFHHTADDDQYTTPYSSELGELHDQDHGEMGSYRHEEPDEEGPRIHGQEMGHEDAYSHLSEHHGHNYDELRSEEPSASHLEQYHEEAHDRERGSQWNTHHRNDPWDFSEGKARRVHPLEKDPDEEDEDEGHHTAGVTTSGVRGALDPRTAAYDWDTDEGPFTWDEIGDRYPHLYGDPDVNRKAPSHADGFGIGDAAAHLYHDRPGQPYEETYGGLHPTAGAEGGEMLFHPRTVDPSRIDYARSEPGDPRVRRARQGYEGQQPERVPPLILVHRHGVFQVADGHHRAEGAAKARKPVRAYVAYSSHEDEPFSDGERAPYHGASTEEPEVYPDQHGIVRRDAYPGFPHAADVSRPQAHEASRATDELVAHFSERHPVQLDNAHDTVLAPSSFLDPVLQAAAALGAWAPGSAAEAVSAARDLPGAFTALHDALRRLACTAEELPVSPDVADALHQAASAARGAAGYVTELADRLPQEGSCDGSPNH